MRTPGNPIKYHDSPPELDLVAPTLGQHNRTVLTEVLGLTDAELAELEAAGILRSDYV